VFWGAFAQREPVANARHLAQLMQWVADGTIAPVVSAQYPLASGAVALRDILERRVVGKVVITPHA
jgi:NADPH2:quinone reductase